MTAISVSPYRVSAPVAGFIVAVAVAATAAMTATAGSVGTAAAAHPAEFAEFIALSLVLQLFSVRVFDGGAIGVSPVGLIAVGIALGPGPALFAGVLAGMVRLVASRGLAHKGIFDAAQFALSAWVATGVYRGLVALVPHTGGQILASVAAGAAYSALNNSVLCTVIGLDEGESPRKVWSSRFRWARYHYLAFGPLAYAAVEGHRAIGVLGVIAFSLPPGLLMLTFRQYMERTKQALDKERKAKERVERQNRDLADLYAFSTSLAEHADDVAGLIGYAEDELARIFGAASVRVGAIDEPGIQLTDNGRVVATLVLDEGEDFDRERWKRLLRGIELQLAPALERARLAERMRRAHLETIAALSRSMEAKDHYTGNHTERVAEVAVALGRRLGVAGEDLAALEVGALLHDIGKIGIPERIINKDGPLDEDEWRVMKQHPVISEHILAGLDLSPIVRHVARSSHERVDGGGYPDGLGGDAIPLAARIVLVADAWDALTSDRSYRPARRAVAAMAEIHAHTGTQFCPTVVAALEQLYREDPAVLGASPLQAVRVA